MRNFATLAAALVMSLLLSAHAETFHNPQLIQTSYDPQAVATADLNGDGILDLVYVDGEGPFTLHVLLGNGDGTFSHKVDVELPPGIGPIINLADVTNDGVIDAILGGADSGAGEIFVLPGKGDGTFQAPVISTVVNSGENGGSASFNLVFGVGDVNKDGAIDIVAGDARSATVYILLGDNTGKFTLGTTLAPYYFTGDVQTHLFDVNGDGNLDIVANDLIGAQTSVFLGNGDGTFKSAVTYVSFAILFMDMDGDGHPDLVGEVNGNQIQILSGNPDGTFASPQVVATVPAGSFLIAGGDFNGDGIPDLVFLTPVGIGIVLGQGNLTYGSLTNSLAGPLSATFEQSVDITSGGFYSDGHRDIATGVEGGLLVLQGNGDGTFVSGASYDVGKTVGTISMGDFNGDTIPDIAATVSATYPRILLGAGNGTFTLAPDQNQSYTTQSPATSMVTADFNGDGKSDLDVLESTTSFPYGQPFVLFGNGNSTFENPLAISTGPSFVGDVNNDGRADMVSQSNESILVLLGQSDDTFTQVTTSLIHPTSSGVAALGNINHDEKLDALTFEFPNLRVWFGNGDGTFTEGGLVSPTSTTLLNAQTVVIQDLDGDGNGDILVVPYPNQLGLPFPLTIFYGNGDGTFQNAVSLPISHAYTTVVVADVNHDGLPDLVMTEGGGIAVMLNQGNRSYGSEEHYVAGRAISGLSVVDVNGDGYPDIVAANAGGTTVAVLLNEPNGNSAAGLPSNGVFTISPEPAFYSQPVTLSITMSVSSGPVPTGSVSFSVDGAFITAASLKSGTASYVYKGVLNTGSHTFVATYTGDKTYAAESFAFLHTVESPVYPTTTVLAATPSTVFTSQTVSLTATVSSSVSIPAGVVTFFDGTNTLGAKQMILGGSSVFLLDTNLLSAGTHTLTAEYHGWQDPFNEQAIYQPSTSAPITVVVNANPTSITLSPSTTSAIAGTVVNFSVTVASGSGVPFGGVTFYDGTAPLGTSSLQADGSCTYSTAGLSVGTHSITATFNANATFSASTSTPASVTINSAPSGLTQTAVLLASADSGDYSILTAQVAAPAGAPSGLITFLDGGTILGSVFSSVSGTASFSLPELGSGSHNLYASFAGSAQFAPSVSPVLIEQLPSRGPGFSLLVSPNSVSLGSPQGQSIQLTVIPSSGFSGNVQLSCGDGLPAGYRCSFTPRSLTSGVSVLRIQPTSKSAVQQATAWWYAAIIGMASMLLAVPLRRRRPRPITASAVCLLLAVVIGCGTTSESANQGQLAVLSIQASAISDSSTVLHSAQILVRFQ